MKITKEQVTWYGKYTDPTEWPDWFRDAMASGRLRIEDDKSLAIQTIKGTLHASIGDLVMRMPNGELMRLNGFGAR